MKNYNKSFKVEITANMIADKFMSKLADFPKFQGKKDDNGDIQRKAEKLVDSVLGPMCSNNNSNGLKHLYFGLFDVDIEAPLYKDTDDLVCTETQYRYHKIVVKPTNENEQESEEIKRDRLPIGPCRLIGFDTYRDGSKYEIEYSTFNSKAEVEGTDTMWVSESDLELASDKVEASDA